MGTLVENFFLSQMRFYQYICFHLYKILFLKVKKVHFSIGSEIPLQMQCHV